MLFLKAAAADHHSIDKVHTRNLEREYPVADVRKCDWSLAVTDIVGQDTIMMYYYIDSFVEKHTSDDVKSNHLVPVGHSN